MIKKIIISYFKDNKLKALLITFMILLVTLLALVPAYFLRLIIDEGINSNNIEKLIMFSIIYGIIYLIIGVISFFKDIFMLSTSQDITMLLRLNMMKHIHKTTYKELVNSDSGTLESYFNNDVNSINDLFTSGVVNIITDGFKLLAILINLFIYSYIFGLIVFLILPIIILFTYIIKKLMMKSQLKTKALEGNVNKILLEDIENIEQIKINKAQSYTKSKYKNILLNHFKASQTSNLYDAIFSPFMQIIRNVVIVGILLISGFNNNLFGFSVGMIISSISLITDLFSPIEALGMEIQTIQKSLASVKRINLFFLLEEDDNKEKLALKSNDIILDNVSFGYDDKLIINDFNLKISQGDKIAFQGPSGVGKSTLLKLIMGVIKPSNGSVTIGGVPSYLLSDNEKNKLFSIVYQDPFFSLGSIYDELTLLDTSITKEKVKEVLGIVGLGYIKELDTKLNINNYSSGELALLNIARIILRNTKIIFLDEMNSKIDPITAKKIINIINTITKDKIVISINHYGDILDNAKIVNLSLS